ncbi:MAG: hypothetical protein IJX40_05475, partial [Alistipes sp.]|nr:hypothetical protein [Alistipes sp.]
SFSTFTTLKAVSISVGSIKLTRESSISVFIIQRYYFFISPPPLFGCPKQQPTIDKSAEVQQAERVPLSNETSDPNRSLVKCG